MPGTAGLLRVVRLTFLTNGLRRYLLYAVAKCIRPGRAVLSAPCSI